MVNSLPMVDSLPLSMDGIRVEKGGGLCDSVNGRGHLDRGTKIKRKSTETLTAGEG